MAWLYVPESLDLNSESSSQPNTSESNTAAWCTLSGKPSPRPLSWRGWRARPWVKLLSGMTLRPSTASRGVELWILSLAATHANPSASPVASAAKTTPGTSGPRSSASSRKLNPNGVSLKMWETTFDLDSEKSSPSWRVYTTALRQDYSRLRRWARRTFGRDFSYWPTGQAGDYKAHSPGWSKAAKRHAENGVHKQCGLRDYAVMWPTATTKDNRYTSAGSKEKYAAGPTLFQGKYRRQVGQMERVEKLLPAQAEAFQSSRPDPQTAIPGKPSSANGRKLNPQFVEWLMGLPQGWTLPDTATTDFGDWATRSSHLLRLLLSSYYGDGLR